MCIHMCVYIYIYIHVIANGYHVYMYAHPGAFQGRPRSPSAHCPIHLSRTPSYLRKEPVLFESFRSRNIRKETHCFGSVWQLFFPVRCGSACAFWTRRGSVRFGSVRFRVRFRPVPKLSSSVRFVSAGSVRFLTTRIEWLKSSKQQLYFQQSFVSSCFAWSLFSRVAFQKSTVNPLCEILVLMLLPAICGFNPQNPSCRPGPSREPSEPRCVPDAASVFPPTPKPGALEHVNVQPSWVLGHKSLGHLWGIGYICTFRYDSLYLIPLRESKDRRSRGLWHL